MPTTGTVAKQAYTGVNLGRVRDLAVKGWAVGIALACLLMIPAPPTAQIGAVGWLAGCAVQGLSLAGLLLFLRYRAKVGLGHLLVVTWALPIDVGIMQWLAGGWDAPYHELHLLALILGSAALPPRRFAWFAAAVTAIALTPALYAPDADGLLGMVVELTIWLFVTTALALLMARVRGQARLARMDQLTQLANRRALDELFALPRTGPLVLAIGDLDRFKQINDRHGHLAGDACLADVARVLAASSRAADQVFRWGGDEFAVLLPGASEAEARLVLARLEAAVAEAVRDPDGTPVTITFGFAGGGPEIELRTLTSEADAALLARKASTAGAPRTPIR